MLAALLAASAARGAVPDRFSDAALHAAAIALRAQWLAKGRDVRQLVALALPRITGGHVVAPAQQGGLAGAFAALSVSYSTDTPGPNLVSVQLARSTGERASAGAYIPAGSPRIGTLIVGIAAPAHRGGVPGAWSVAGATICDNAGNSTSYTARQLAGLITGLPIKLADAGRAAHTAPRIGGGQPTDITIFPGTDTAAAVAGMGAQDRNVAATAIGLSDAGGRNGT